MQKPKSITRRDFLKAVPITLAVASCTDKPKAAHPKQPTEPKKDVEEVNPEPKVDLEPDRLRYLEQMRTALVERALSPIEQGAINLALHDLPDVRNALNELIEKHRGRILDIKTRNMAKN